MMNSDIHLKLLANVPIEIDGIGEFQLPSTRQIIQMGESVYHTYLNMLMFSKEIVELENVEDVSDFDVMGMVCFHSLPHRELMNNSFKLFLNKDMKVAMIDDSYVIFFDELSEDNVLTEEKWEYIKKIAKIGNFIQENKEEKIIYADDEVKSFWEKMRKKREQAAKSVKKEEKINLHSILSAVACRTLGISESLNLTIYQLYDIYFRLGLIDNYKQITTGIYSGTVDQSKIKLPDINWANIIKIN